MRALRATLLALGALLLLAAPASAAPAVTPTTATIEDIPITFTANGTAGGDSIWATFRPADSACATTFAADIGGHPGTGIIFGGQNGASATATRDAGAYLVCSYLGDSFADMSPSQSATLSVTVRENAATVGISAPATVPANEQVKITLTGTTEQARRLYASIVPGEGDCPASAGQDNTPDFADESISAGNFSVEALPRVPMRGKYRICAWVQETADDPAGEAKATKPLDVSLAVPVIGSFMASPRTFDRTDGTQLRYGLENVAGRVTFTVGVPTAGRRVGSSCRKPTKALRKRKRCTRYRRISGSFSQVGRVGTNLLRWRGRVGSRTLKRGDYRLYAKPRNSAGTGREKMTSFRIK